MAQIHQITKRINNVDTDIYPVTTPEAVRDENGVSLATKITNTYRYKGFVNFYSDLQNLTSVVTGDAYRVLENDNLYYAIVSDQNIITWKSFSAESMWTEF